MIREAESARSYVVFEAAQRLGRFYMWGGEGGREWGYDCSGVAWDVFDAAAQHWPELAFGRVPAKAIFAHFRARGCPEIRAEGELRPGCLIFWHYPGREIFHVSIHVASGPFGHLAIESGGAGANATNLDEALRASACVRPTSSIHHSRGAEWVAVDPFTLLKR